jgi:predicted transport protein
MSMDSIKKAVESQVKNLEEKTGKTIYEWKSIVNNSGLEKHGELVSKLKEKYGIGHGYANMVVHKAKETGAGSSADDELVTEQYKGKEALKDLYDLLIKEIQQFGNDVELSPKKAYVSIRRKKQFAILQPSTKTRLDIGLMLKDTAAKGNLEAAGTWNAMCTHRIKLESKADVTPQLIKWIKQSYDLAG